MYYLEINKAKTLKGLCLFLTALIMIASSILNIYAEQPISYGNYPVLRGTTNPQEIQEDNKITDAGRNLRQMVLASRLKAFKPQNNKIYPSRQLTNLDTIIALTALSGTDKDITNTDNLQETYKAKAIEQGFITEEELSKKENEKFFENKTTMRQLNNYFSKIMNKEIKYASPTNKIATRLDLANMIYDNKQDLLNKENISIYSGQVLSKSQIVEDGKNKSLITVKLDRNIVIKKDSQDTKRNSNNKNNSNTVEKPEYAENQVDKIVDDNSYDSTVVSYLNIISQKDIPILTPSGFTTDVNNIWEQSQINIYAKNNNIIYVEQFNVQTSEVVGVFESIMKEDKQLLSDDSSAKDDKVAENTTDIIKIKDYDNKAHLYKLHPNVKILQVNGEIGDNISVEKPVDKDQLSYGQDVSLTVRNGVVTSIKGYVPVEEELNSYVPPESQLSSGIVLDVNDSSITLTNNKTYSISSDTLIMKNGEITDYRQIKDGDRLKFFFDDIYSNIPSKIEIEGNQRQADRIIKAKVGPYSTASKSITLKDTKELQNGQWVDTKEDAKAYENVKIRGNIYANSAKVNNKLKNYNNQEIYAVLAKNQGIPTIEQGKIRLGDSLKFDSSITNIDYSQNTLQIDGNLVKFDDSTIIIKDGNIVKSGNLEKNINSNIETNLLKTAQIIVQTGATLNIDKSENYPYKIYRGTLRDVFDYSVLLGNDIENGRKVNHYFMWQGGVWNRLSEGKTTPRINFTEQTQVYDFDNNKALTIDEIRQKQYALNAFGIRPDYFNRQVYVVTKDDVAVSINFIKTQGYVQVNSQNLIVAKGVGEYTSSDNNNNNGNNANNNNNSNNNANNNNNNQKKESIKPVLIKNIYEYNSNTNRLQPVAPITTTDTATQQIKKTPVRKLINVQKAVVIYNGKAIMKTSPDTLKDKNLTIIFKQNRDKKITNNIEELDAIVVIAE